jgi:hypothetical protein
LMNNRAAGFADRVADKKNFHRRSRMVRVTQRGKMLARRRRVASLI